MAASNYRNLHKLRRQQEASQVRVDRVVTGYFHHKHPEIYEKAMELYTELNTLYPQKKDLRRTYEYQNFVTGSTTNKYRYSRRSHNSGNTRNITDNMVLQIPLMANPETHVPDIPTVPDVPTVTAVPDVPAVTPVPDVPPVTAVPDVPAVTAVPDVPAVTAVPDVPAVTAVPDIPPVTAVPDVPAVTAVPDIPAVTAVPDVPLVPVDISMAECTIPPLSDEIINDIVYRLRQDPDIDTFFEDMDIQDLTPLESELSLL